MLNESPQQGPELRYEEGWGTLPPPAHEQQLPVGCPPPLGLHRDGLFKGILPAEKSWPTQALSGRRGTRHPAALLARAACCCPAAGKAQAGCSVAVPGPLLASVQKSVFPLCFHAVRLGRQGWWCMGVPAMFNALKKNAPLPVSAFDCASSPVCERRDTWHAQNRCSERQLPVIRCPSGFASLSSPTSCSVGLGALGRAAPAGNVSEWWVGVPRELHSPALTPLLCGSARSVWSCEAHVQLLAQTLLVTFNLHWRVAKSRNKGCLLISLFFQAAFQEQLNHPGNASFS